MVGEGVGPNNNVSRSDNDKKPDPKDAEYCIRRRGVDNVVDLNQISKPHSIVASRGFPGKVIGQPVEENNAGGLLRNDGHRPSREKPNIAGEITKTR